MIASLCSLEEIAIIGFAGYFDFWNISEVTGSIISFETFIYKVIFYLWNDVFKDEPKNSIFKDNITYQDFFPIEENGKNLVISMFKDLNITESEKTELE